MRAGRSRTAPCALLSRQFWVVSAHSTSSFTVRSTLRHRERARWEKGSSGGSTTVLWSNVHCLAAHRSLCGCDVPAICFTCFTRIFFRSLLLVARLVSPVRSDPVRFGSVLCGVCGLRRRALLRPRTRGIEAKMNFVPAPIRAPALQIQQTMGGGGTACTVSFSCHAMQPRTGGPQDGVSLDRIDCVLSCCTIKLNARLYRRKRRSIVTVIITIVVTSCTHPGLASVCLGPSILSKREAYRSHDRCLQKSPVGAPLPEERPSRQAKPLLLLRSRR